MSLTLYVCMVCLGQPGPLDAFRANHAAIRARVDYTVRGALVHAGDLARWNRWDADQPLLDGMLAKSTSLSGVWSCDGIDEHFIQESGAKSGPKLSPLLSPLGSGIELLRRGETVAWHPLGRATIDILQTKSNLAVGFGPFQWWADFPFPEKLEVLFPGVKPARSRSELDGFAVEWEDYGKGPNDSRVECNVAYDPSIGWLPRYIRLLSRDGKNGSVQELFMVAAEPCAQGGFIPRRWALLSYPLPDFSVRYPNYDRATRIIPYGRDAYVQEFRARSVSDLDGPLALRRLNPRVVLLSAPGGSVQITPKGPTLTFDQIQGHLGNRMTTAGPIRTLDIDRQELERYLKPTDNTALVVGLVVAGLTLAVVTFLTMRRIRAAPLLLLALGVLGCDPSSPASARLVARFARESFICDEAYTKNTLIVRNEGSRPLRVFDADGGCSCRQLDRSGMPAQLSPGAELRIGVRLMDQHESEPKVYAFTFQTSEGLISVPVTVQMVSRHILRPAFMTLHLSDSGESSEFEVMHRAVYDPGEAERETHLEVTSDFEVVNGPRREDYADPTGRFQFRDTTYHLRLVNREVGLHSTRLALVDSHGAVIEELPVTWNRVPFLACVPPRLTLGTRQQRVFLCCPDREVELIKVLKVPTGLVVTITAPRELTVDLGEDVPDVLEGTIEVETSAHDHRLLRIPVVRYQPIIADTR